MHSPFTHGDTTMMRSLPFRWVACGLAISLAMVAGVVAVRYHHGETAAAIVLAVLLVGVVALNWLIRANLPPRK